jgi:iron complex transport system ATP-binding protein
MLRAENLRLVVPGRTLCRDLNVALQPGECWGILGRNGSGKTTLLHALSGLTRPGGGTVSLDGRPILDYPRRNLALRLGVLLQAEDHGFWGTVLEYVLLGRFPHRHGLGLHPEDEAAAQAALHQVGMADMAGRLVATLSGGERQRVRIAMLLAQAPGIYCLDEPLQHLDLRHQAETVRLLRGLAREGGATVLMVLHETLWAGRFCDRVLMLYDDGEVQSGPAADLLTRSNLERLYGCALRELRTEHGPYYVPD